MAISIRRALSTCRRIALVRQASVSSYTRDLSYLVRSSSPIRRISDFSFERSYLPATTFALHECRRGFAKGRKQRAYESEDEDEDDGNHHHEDVAVEPANIKANTVSQMEAALDSLSRELAKLRTGRASPGMLDHIIVEIDGLKTPLCRMAVVSVLDPKTLSVTPYDPNALKAVEKAIVSSPLGLNPKVDNQRLIAAIPPLTKEHMQAVCKVVTKSSEDVKQSIRRARQKAFDTIKRLVSKPISKNKDRDKDKTADKKKDKDKATFSEDQGKRLEREIDDLSKKFLKSAEDVCKAKEKEISGS